MDKMHYFREITCNNDENLKALLTGGDTVKDQDLSRSIFRKHVEIINLESSSYCNRKCHYCPVSSSGDRQFKQTIIDTELFKKIIEQLKSIRYEKTISLNLYNEPLENPRLNQQILYIRENLPKSYIFFNSNGDRLNRNKLDELIDCGTNAITVTLHPSAKQKQSPEKIRLRVNKLLEKLNQCEADLLQDTDFIKQNTFYELSMAGLRLKIQWPDYSVNGTYRGGLVEMESVKSWARTVPCAKPFREFTIYHDGSVVPCCEVFHDEKISSLVLDDLNHTSIFSAYLSSQLSAFRRQTFTFGEKSGVCRQCNVLDYSDPGEANQREQFIKEHVPA